MNAEPKLSPDLRATLLQIFALGYIEQMAGCEVTDDDEIDSETASEIEAAALVCINKAESFIGTNYAENPQQVHNEVYLAGRWAYRQAESLWMQRN